MKDPIGVADRTLSDFHPPTHLLTYLCDLRHPCSYYTRLSYLPPVRRSRPEPPGGSTVLSLVPSPSLW